VKRYIVLFMLVASPAFAQQPVNTSTFLGLPPAGTITGNELIPLDQNGVTKRATSSQLTLGSIVLGIASGGTGMSTVGSVGTCLVSNGINLVYAACGGTGPIPPASNVIIEENGPQIIEENGPAIIEE